MSDMDLDAIIEEAYDDFMEDFQIDPNGSINNMLFELFAAGFDSCYDMIDDEE